MQESPKNMGLTPFQAVIIFLIAAVLVFIWILPRDSTKNHSTHPAPASAAVDVNSTDGITQAEVDSLQVGDLLRRNDGLIVAIAHIKDDGSIHYWGKGHALTGDYTCPRKYIPRAFVEVYKRGTPQWKWAAESFIMKQ
ncbi:MAG: hypothetical protein V1846_04445 [Candidatus Komeilibacteria bacterium]